MGGMKKKVDGGTGCGTGIRAREFFRYNQS